MRNFKENLMQVVFFISALAAVAAVALICLFLFANGFPAIREIGFINFLFGEVWAPSREYYGILPFILGSIYVTAGAIVVGVPIGILSAIFMARFCPKKQYKLVKPAINLLAGIPSVVYGFFGLVVLVPLIMRLPFEMRSGQTMLAAAILLGIMILPTIVAVSESALRAVPDSYYEGALALGASHERSVFFCVLPAAKSGIFAAVILGIGRAMGETMAVIMVSGNQPRMPQGLLQGVRTMTANIGLEMSYAQPGLHRDSLIATGVVLFVFILIINISFSLMKSRSDRRMEK